MKLDNLDNDERLAIRRAIYQMSDGRSALRAIANTLEARNKGEANTLHNICADFDRINELNKLYMLL